MGVAKVNKINKQASYEIKFFGLFFKYLKNLKEESLFVLRF